ncbi:uncharacterized protein [Argopecten irradians]|uniref:uncharacterized protein n=1 Tax=Argopecten irradians TaxID=31199 RepID=UPI003722F56F
MISKMEILTSLKRLRKPEPNPRKNKKSDCISSLKGIFSTRERQHTARTALIVIGEEGQWSKEDTRLLDTETQEERISLLIVGVGIQSFSALNAIQTIASENRKFYVLPSYRSLKRLSEELTTGPCLPMSLETSGSEIEQPATHAPLPKLKFYKGCRELADGKTYIREIPFLGWQQLTCPEGTRIDTSDCKCRLSTEPIKWKPEVTSIATINVLTPAPKTHVPVPTTPMSSTVQDLFANTAKMTSKNPRPLQGNCQDTSPKSMRVQTTTQKTTLKSNPVSRRSHHNNPDIFPHQCPFLFRFAISRESALGEGDRRSLINRIDQRHKSTLFS